MLAELIIHLLKPLNETAEVWCALATGNVFRLSKWPFGHPILVGAYIVYNSVVCGDVSDVISTTTRSDTDFFK